jgi:hypothetical protein
MSINNTRTPFPRVAHAGRRRPSVRPSRRTREELRGVRGAVDRCQPDASRLQPGRRHHDDDTDRADDAGWRLQRPRRRPQERVLRRSARSHQRFVRRVFLQFAERSARGVSLCQRRSRRFADRRNRSRIPRAARFSSIVRSTSLRSPITPNISAISAPSARRNGNVPAGTNPACAHDRREHAQQHQRAGQRRHAVRDAPDSRPA